MLKEKKEYRVDVKNIGHWYESWIVWASSEEEAKANWIDGEQQSEYEHCTNEDIVVEVAET
tara:strand:+ start:662 stop:844 length:183 start_codon:yes stop_codon:yes gene_type:complete